MTKEEAKDLSDVLAAYSRGEKIEFSRMMPSSPFMILEWESRWWPLFDYEEIIMSPFLRYRVAKEKNA